MAGTEGGASPLPSEPGVVIEDGTRGVAVPGRPPRIWPPPTAWASNAPPPEPGTGPRVEAAEPGRPIELGGGSVPIVGAWAPARPPGIAAAIPRARTHRIVRDVMAGLP